jgi:hypothetical protein
MKVAPKKSAEVCKPPKSLEILGAFWPKEATDERGQPKKALQ